MKDFRNLFANLIKGFRDSLSKKILRNELITIIILNVSIVINVYLINYRSTYVDIKDILDFTIIKIRKYYNSYY